MIYATDCPSWMRRLPFWVRDRLARRWRALAKRHAEAAYEQRDEAKRYQRLAAWILPETDE